MLRIADRLLRSFALAVFLCGLVAGPHASAQPFLGALSDGDDVLGDGMYYDMYTFHCVGGEAFRLSLRSIAFNGRIIVMPPEDGAMIASPPPQLVPERGTFIDVIANTPGDYVVAVTSLAPGQTGAYELRLSPLTHGQWVTDRQGVGQSEGGKLEFALLAMPGPGRLLAYADGLQPVLSIAAGQAGGDNGPSQAFGLGGGAVFPVDFVATGVPLATATLANGRNGEVYWAYQRYVPAETVEAMRSRTPQRRIDGHFPEGGPRRTSFNITLAQDQFFFTFIATENMMDVEGALNGEDEGPSYEDYRVSITGPDGAALRLESDRPYMAEFRAPAAGQYTIHVSAVRDVPDTFKLAYSMGRSVPAIDAPIRWSTGEGRAVFTGMLDDTCELISGRPSLAYGIPVKARDHVVIDLWSEDFLPSVIVATPDEQGHSNHGLDGSDQHARVSFIAEEDGLCTVFVVGRTPEANGEFQMSVGVAVIGATTPGPDPLDREDPTAGGWTTQKREAGTLDDQDQTLDGRYYEGYQMRVDADDTLRLTVTGDGYRADLLVALPNGGDVLEPVYDAETNTSTVIIPPGTEGTLDFVISAMSPGEGGGYTFEVQGR